ncbi:sialate O-acetylesterase [Anaerotaenia torta]|uniref:sialate O-acetylesterase n=1 Tax=Anaerotaenia torta TaxID=433293 RepID=UPI003D22A722
MEKSGLILAPVFSDGMVLQRNKINCIYGTEREADRVILRVMGGEYSQVPDEEGDFCIFLPPVPAGGPYSITVRGSREIIISDVFFGDVFLLAGQSNMELPLRRVLDVSGEEVSRTCEPEIRQYLLPAEYQFHGPRKYMAESSWKKAAGEDLMGFSAVGYFFAKEIRDAFQVPVGLIMAAVGGSTIEAWMSPDALHKFGEYDPRVKAFYNQEYFQCYMKEQQEPVNRWLSELEEEELKAVSQENYKEWKTCTLPSLVRDYTDEFFQGSVYLCREVALEEEPADEEGAGIYMGTIIDSDQIWINEMLIGRTEYRYPPRKYQIPRGVLRKGSNRIMLRIVINRGNGGTIKGRPYYLSCGGKKLCLEGEWFYRIGKRTDTPMPEALFPASLPTGLYHTAIAPLQRTAFQAILWYQGESNTSDPKEYAGKFEEMLTSWRRMLGCEVPCIYVQLPNYQEPLGISSDSGWAELREQQRQGLKLEQVAMVAALDLGEYNDLHPQNKKGIGVRLAWAAKALIYHEEEENLCPIPEEARTSGKQAVICFRYLEALDLEQEINHFELAGRDGIYYPAKAVRKGAQVTVTSGQVDIPVSVRYAWRDNPENINFYNAKGLPAACFRMSL